MITQKAAIAFENAPMVKRGDWRKHKYPPTIGMIKSPDEYIWDRVEWIWRKRIPTRRKRPQD